MPILTLPAWIKKKLFSEGIHRTASASDGTPAALCGMRWKRWENLCQSVVFPIGYSRS